MVSHCLKIIRFDVKATVFELMSYCVTRSFCNDTFQLGFKRKIEQLRLKNNFIFQILLAENLKQKKFKRTNVRLLDVIRLIIRRQKNVLFSRNLGHYS